MTSGQLRLLLQDDAYAVCKLDPNTPIPAWATKGDFFSVTGSADELSIVCRQDAAPHDVRCEPGWRCLRVAGAMPFSIVGVLASLTAPLAEAGISLFAVSTFDTDYLFVKEEKLEAAIAALERRGHTIDR
jgi:hypothetical protein